MPDNKRFVPERLPGLEPRDGKVAWHELTPEQATALFLPHPHIWGPVNELGEECPWPWDPQQLVGAPLGQYHCPYCGGMNMAGMRHMDFAGLDYEALADA